MSNAGFDDSIRVAADAMLGSLAQYLLLAGLDTEYHADVTDDELRQMAEDGRIVLTRDRALYESLPPQKRYYVEQDDPEQQFKQLVNQLELPIERDRLFTRCTDCNRKLAVAPSQAVDEQVPLQTRRWIDHYQQCPECGSVYWKGSHYEYIVDQFTDWNLLHPTR